MADHERARREIGSLGEFFALEAIDAPGHWRTLGELVAGSGVDERVEHTATTLGRLAGSEVEPRVAASIASLGLFARLLSPSLGAAALGVPGPDPDGLQWQHAVAGPLTLRATSWRSDVVEASLEDVAGPLLAVFVEDYSLSTTIVRGNLASAVMGSLRMVGVTRPDLVERVHEVADDLLATASLAGTAQQRRPFVRRSCCLYYRIPGGGYCGDCVLAHR